MPVASQLVCSFFLFFFRFDVKLPAQQKQTSHNISLRTCKNKRPVYVVLIISADRLAECSG